MVLPKLVQFCVPYTHLSGSGSDCSFVILFTSEALTVSRGREREILGQVSLVPMPPWGREGYWGLAAHGPSRAQKKRQIKARSTDAP